MTGTLGILNVGAGDVELRFDSTNEAEKIRAGRIVKDMLRRGYALLVEVDRNGEKRFERALDFDEASCRYIIADFDSVAAEEADAWSTTDHITNQEVIKRKEAMHGESVEAEISAPAPGASAPGKQRGRPKKTSVDAGSTRAVAVGRSAGG